MIESVLDSVVVMPSKRQISSSDFVAGVENVLNTDLTNTTITRMLSFMATKKSKYIPMIPEDIEDEEEKEFLNLEALSEAHWQQIRKIADHFYNHNMVQKDRLKAHVWGFVLWMNNSENDIGVEITSDKH